MDPQTPPAVCPRCAAPLAANAVLCVNCGYHLKLDLQLATLADSEVAVQVEETPIDDNPYASPQSATESRLQHGRKAVFDLTERGAREAEKIASDAELARILAPLAICLCPFTSLFVLPWSVYRLFGWYRLNAQFEELRYPNSLSPHVEMALRFQTACSRLWVGAIGSALIFLLYSTFYFLSLLRE